MIAPDACGVKKPGLAMLPLFVRGSQSTRAVSARHPARRHRRRGALHSASAAPVPGVAGPPVVLHELSEHAFQVATTDYQKVIQALAPCWPHLSLGERISPLGPLQPWTALKRGCGAWTGVRWAARCVDGVLGVVQAQREVDCPASTAEAALPLRERARPWGVFIRPLRREAGWWRAGWLAAAGLIAPTSLSLPLTNRAGTPSRLIGSSAASTLLARAADPPLCPPPSDDRPPHPPWPPNTQPQIAISNFSSSDRSCSSSDAQLHDLAGGWPIA